MHYNSFIVMVLSATENQKTGYAENQQHTYILP